LAHIGSDAQTFAGNVTVTGTLTVDGATTFISSTNLQVEDKNILINKGGSTSGSTSAGINIEGDGAAVVGYIKVGASANTVFELNPPGNAFVFTIDINATETLTIGGSLDVEADSIVNQDLSSDSTTAAFGVLTLPNTGLHLLDTNASHDLIIAPGSNITADRTLTLTTGDGDRTLTLSGNLDCEAASIINQDLSTDSSTAAFGTLTLSNTGLHLLDTNGSHDLIIAPGSDISADRTLTVTTGDGDRTLTLSADLNCESASIINQDLSSDSTSAAFGVLTLPNTGLHILDTNASHDLIIAPGSNITADRTLTLTTGDADATISIEGTSSVINQDLSTDSTAAAFATLTTTTQCKSTAVTESTSTTTGSAVFSGGVGIAKDIWLGDDLTLDSDGCIVNLGAAQDVSITHLAAKEFQSNSKMYERVNASFAQRAFTASMIMA